MTPKTDSGNVLEKTVIGAFQGKKIQILPFSDWKKKPVNYGDELLLTNVPYDTIYGHKGYTEFLLRSKRFQKEIRIECKWQQWGGSVDEKLPYLYLNAIEKMPEKEIIIVIDGDGWKEGAIPWLRDTVIKKKYVGNKTADKIVRVFNLKEFLMWVNDTFR